MSNFSDYIKNGNIKKDNIDKSAVNNSSTVDDTEKLEDLIDKYSKYSNDRLLSEFLKLTIDKKKRGTLKDEELINIKSTLTPFLNAEQKDSLDKIIEMVKNV